MKTLAQIVDALHTTEEELRFHAQRLAERTQADTRDEAGHIDDLAERYENAARAVRILRRYQEGRLRSRSDVLEDDPATDRDGVDDRGIARAVV